MAPPRLRFIAGADDPFFAALGDREPARELIVRLARECILPQWRILLVTLAAMVAVAMTSGALPLLLQRVADDIFVAKNADQLYVLPALILVVMTFRAAAEWVTTVSEAHLGTKVVAGLRVRLFDATALADLAWLQRNHSGRFVSAIISETGAVDRAATRVLLGLFRNSLSVLFLLGAMFYMDWRLSLIVLIGAPIAVINLGRQRKRIRSAVHRSMQESGELGSMLTQTLQSIRVVKAYSQEANEGQRFRRIVASLRKYQMRTVRSRAAIGPVSDALTGLGIAAAVFYGGWQGIYGEVTLGHFTGFMAAAMLAFQPLKALANTHATLAEGLLAAHRVFAMIDYSSRVAEKPGAKPLAVTRGAISFTDVAFGYETGGLILSGFNLEIGAGQKVALVGPSGAGKSTVLNLILRFYDPSRGTIRIDGQDLRDTTLASVRGASALLTQDPVIFDDTVAANIRYGSPDAPDADVVRAAEAAAAHDFIMRLPEAYQTRVGEGGNRLSGGERQRIAFARAMLRNAPILLLDEPTSALDADSEARVQAAMERLLSGRTVVMIAHRLATVKRADLICVMEAGGIIESGRHEELVARRGRYASMVQAQLLDDGPRLARAGG